MTGSLRFDLSDFERAARNMGAFVDQVPFALARALNDAAEQTRREMIETTWPSHVTVRNTRFLNAALTTKGERATKKSLRVAIYDKLGRASLPLHVKGGVKQPKRQSLALPSREIAARRSGKGVPKGLRPKNLPNSFVKGDAIYQRVGKGKQAKLKLAYVLKPSAQIKPDVPFDRDFERVMRREIVAAFGPRMRDAMMSRRNS